jgi:hypothetical protein
LLLLAPSNETTRRCRCTSPSHATELRLALLFPLSCLLTQVRLGVAIGPSFVVRLLFSSSSLYSTFSLKDQLAKSEFVDQTPALSPENS